MLTVFLGDDQTFDVTCYDASIAGTDGPVTPASGYFSMYRVADDLAVIDHATVTTISGNYVDYLLEESANTIAGYMCYVFEIHFENGYTESFKQYCEIIEPRR